MVLAVGLALATLLLASAPASARDSAVGIEGSGTGTISVNTATGATTGEESGVSRQLGKYTLELQGNSALSAAEGFQAAAARPSDAPRDGPRGSSPTL
jgi:hypothetical protein